MARIEPKILKGFRDYLPETMIQRKRMIERVCAVFERFGFSPLDTPTLEYAEVLLGKYGGEAENLIYRFLDNGGRDVAMRYDLTIPLARVVAMNRNLPRPFKRYQVGNVWRAENPGRGRFREFTQCDVDIIGSVSLAADAECLAVDDAVMRELGVVVVIRVNNRKVFRGLQEILAVEDGRRMNDVLRAIDKLPKIGADGVGAELENLVGLSSVQVERTLAFCQIGGSNNEVLERLADLFTSSEMGQRGLAELREVLARAIDMGVAVERVRLDPSIARGLDYYTGTVFETFIDGLPGFGSIMSGGRYDDLIGLYAGEAIPAVGISVGLDRLLAGLTELGKVTPRVGVGEVLVTVFDAASQPYSLRLAALLRAEGVNTEVYLDAGAKLKKQLKYADSLGIPLVVIAGPDEAAADGATLRNMRDGAQLQCSREELAARVRGLLASASPGQ